MEEMEGDQISSEFNVLFGARRSEMLENYKRVRDPYLNEYGLPEIDPLRHEVALALIFGLYQAAITLTNHMLEALLKYSLIYHHAKEHQPPTDQFVKGEGAKALVDWLSPGKELYANKDLDYTINRACTLGFISKAQKRRLHAVRERFRNAFSHADKDKTFGNAATDIHAGRFNGEKMVSEGAEQIQLADFLIGQGFFQVLLARQNAIPYFLFIDKIARQICDKLFPPESPSGDAAI